MEYPEHKFLQDYPLSSKLIKILLVTANEGDVKLMRYNLQTSCSGCFQLTQAKDLVETFDRLRASKFDLVFLDLSLSDSSGVKAVVQIHQAFPHIPIIVITNHQDPKIKELSLRAGAQSCLSKGDVSGNLLLFWMQYIIKINQLVQQLKEELGEQRRLAKIKDDFLNMISHEMRTPLAIIKGNTGNLKDGILGELNEKQQKVLESSQSNIKRLERIISNLLDLARLGSDKMILHLQKIEIETIIKKVVSDYQKLAQDKGVVLSCQMPPSIPTLNGDSELIIQVMHNLLDNALRFTRTKLQIEVQSILRGEYLNQQKSTKAYLCISVEDDGCGISIDNLEKVFDKFEQINRVESGGGYKGTGLGLAICKKIIDRHQGLIWSESKVGQGSRFSFALPVES